MRFPDPLWVRTTPAIQQFLLLLPLLLSAFLPLLPSHSSSLPSSPPPPSFILSLLSLSPFLFSILLPPSPPLFPSFFSLPPSPSPPIPSLLSPSPSFFLLLLLRPSEKPSKQHISLATFSALTGKKKSERENKPPKLGQGVRVYVTKGNRCAVFREAEQ